MGHLFSFLWAFSLFFPKSFISDNDVNWLLAINVLFGLKQGSFFRVFEYSVLKSS